MDRVEYWLWRIGLAVVAIVVVFIYFELKKQRIEELRVEQHKRKVHFNLETQPIVLYLRSFIKDGIKEIQVQLPWGFSATSPIDSYEMKLDKKIKSIGQFYAINNPEKIESEIGAIRTNFQVSEWQKGVLNLMQIAKLIIYRPNTTPGTLWEFDQIINNGYLNKTIIAVYKDDLLDYINFRQKIQHRFTDSLPYEDAELYIHINEKMEIFYSNDLEYLTVFKKFISREKQNG